MTQDLTTRDIFQQLDTRLSRVEDDLRAFRTEVNSRLDQMQWRTVGLVVVTWLSVMGSIWLKP